MLIPPDASAALLQAGVLVRPASPHEVELIAADDSRQTVTATVERRVLPLSPSHVLHATSDGRGRLLLVVPSATPAALDAAEAAGISVLADDESRKRPVIGRILFPGSTVSIDGGHHAPARSSERRRGRRPWGALAIVRSLLTGGAAGQQALAARARVTQGRVSQALAPLVAAGLVSRTTTAGQARWQAADWDALADWWLDSYPGAGGLTTYWYGLADVTEQARHLVDLMQRYDIPVAVSGDVAADELAPWRRPARAVLYADPAGHPAPPTLSAAGLTPSGPDEATLTLVVPEDHGVWPPPLPAPDAAGLPLADRLQVLWDVAQSPGSDTDQAVTALRTALRTQALATASR
jgi:hypothetical protein